MIAPVTMPLPDGRRAYWADFGNYVGVFSGPAAPGGDPADGRPWPIGDLQFGRSQYTGEIRRLGQPFLGDPAPGLRPPGR